MGRGDGFSHRGEFARRCGGLGNWGDQLWRGSGLRLCAGTLKGWTKSEVLALVWRMFGVEDLDLPETTAGVAEGPLPIAALYEREVARIKAQTSGAVPIYPPLSAGAAPELVTSFGGGRGWAWVRWVLVYG